MEITTADYIGSIGVSLLLIAFLLNLFKKIDQTSIVYILLNCIGAAMACLASVLIHYTPFIILEGSWTLVSIIALINYMRYRSG